MWSNLLVEYKGPVAILTINRPKALNSLDAPTFYQLAEAFGELEKNQEIKVIILTGSGEKAFVAGADISYMKDFTALEGREFALLGQEVMNKIEKLKKPVIAAINGYALGGGCELAMACDLRIASVKAKFGQPEVNLGVTPGFAGTQRLPRLVGKGRAKELLMTGRTIDAEEAYRIGLVNKVVEQELVLQAAEEIAITIAGKGPIAIAMVKVAVNSGLEMDFEKAMAYEADIFGLLFSTLDQKEGMAAFTEKRGPQFIGK